MHLLCGKRDAQSQEESCIRLGRPQFLWCVANKNTHISGSCTPLSARAFCRALKQATKIDSVPPLVVTPAPPGGALNIARTYIEVSQPRKAMDMPPHPS